MFKTTQEFVFKLTQFEHTFNFTGRLVFTADNVNDIGTLHTEDELTAFGDLLNTLEIPEYWTLELLAQHLYTNARPVFSNLYSIELYITEQPQRVVEFSDEYAILRNVTNLEEIA